MRFQTFGTDTNPFCSPTEGVLGHHLIIDFYECRLKGFCTSENKLTNNVDKLKRKLGENKIEVLGSHSHFFGKDAVSITINLSESHLNFHTWPEKEYVSFDFFCCTRLPDIKKIMMNIANYCNMNFFNSAKSSESFIARGKFYSNNT